MKKMVICFTLLLSVFLVGCEEKSEIQDSQNKQEETKIVEEDDNTSLDSKIDEVLSYNTDLKLKTSIIFRNSLRKWMDGEYGTDVFIEKIEGFKEYSQSKIESIENIAIEIENEELTEKQGNIIKYTKRNFEDTIRYLDLLSDGINNDDSEAIDEAGRIVSDIEFSVKAMESLK